MSQSENVSKPDRGFLLGEKIEVQRTFSNDWFMLMSSCHDVENGKENTCRQYNLIEHFIWIAENDHFGSLQTECL